jgi:hypothetical protein
MDDATAITTVDGHTSLQPEIGLHEFVQELGARGDALLGDRFSVLPPAPGAIVHGDSERLMEALVRLLTAAAVDGDGLVELRVLRERDAWRFEVESEPGGFARVEDDADFDLHLAQPDRSERAVALALLRGVAEAHGGSAGVDDPPGDDATYWLRLPKQL